MQKNRRKFIWSKRIVIAVLVLLCLDMVFILGYWQGHSGNPSVLVPSDIAKLESGKPAGVDFSTFWEAWSQLKEKSVAEDSNEKMVQGAISGMLSSTGDPYTVYFTKQENDRFREDIGGQFSGIGVEIVEKNNLPTVVAPLSETPAEKAGIKPGDIILEVDGVKTSDIGFDETINRIRGSEGTKVKLKIAREGAADTIDFEITRQTITVKSVEWSEKTVDGKKVAYIKIRQFGDDTESLFAEAAKEVIKNKPDGIILDLRNDPGGYLETSVNIASYFIKDGVIVSEKGRNDNSKDYRSTGSGTLKDYKVAVLVNGGSASASEILAGALKDRKNSELIGEKTFGKGSVQELIDLSDGSAVKITVAKWFTPNGKQINGEGLEPDIKIANDDKTAADEQLDRAEQFLVTGK